MKMPDRPFVLWTSPNEFVRIVVVEGEHDGDQPRDGTLFPDDNQLVIESRDGLDAMGAPAWKAAPLWSNHAKVSSGYLRMLVGPLAREMYDTCFHLEEGR